MFYLNYLLTSPQEDLPLAEQMEERRLALGFSDDLIFNKFIYGYFLDECAKVPSSLSHYEWFVGSLSARCLRTQLEGFLNSERSKKLDPEVLKQIEEFIHISKTSEDYGYLIDLARAKSLKLLYLSKFGKLMPFGPSVKGASGEEITLIVDKTIDKIQSLKSGETAFFTAGTNIHETQIAIHQINDHECEISYCDTASAPFSLFKTPKEELLDPIFWQQIYKCKLIPTFSGNTLPFGKKMENERILAARHESQNRNTCHILCHLALLKSFVVYRSSLPTGEAVFQWKQFKKEFGKFVLENNKVSDKKLLEACQASQKENKKAFSQSRFLHDCIAQGKEKETIAAFIEVLKNCDVSPDLLGENPSGFDALLHLHTFLLNRLESLPLTPEKALTLFEGIDNPWVKKTFDLFSSRFEERQALALQEIEKEIYLRECGPIPRLYNRYFPSQSGHLTRRAVLSDQMRFKYLDLFEENPHLLDMPWSGAFNYILVQAVQNGDIAQLNRIMAKLSERDQGVYGINIQDAFFFNPTLPKNLEEFVRTNPSSRLGISLARQLIKKGVSEHNIPLLLDLQSHIKGKVTHLNTDLSFEKMEEILKIFSTTEKIEEFPLYSDYLALIMHNLLKNNDFEGFDKLAAYKLPPPQNKFINWDAQWPYLTTGETRDWLKRSESYSGRTPLADFLEQMLLLPQYEHGLLEKMPPHDFGFGGLNYTDFHFEWDEQNFERGLELLKKSCEPLSLQLIEDLVQGACRSRSFEMVKRIIETPQGREWLSCPNSKNSQLFLVFIGLLFENAKEGAHIPNEEEILKTCISSLVSGNSIEKFKLANSIVEYLETKYSLHNLSLEPSAQGYTYIQRFPSTRLSYFLQRKEISETDFFIIKMMWGKNSSTYQKERAKFIQKWIDWTEAHPTADSFHFYKQFILPFFGQTEASLEMALDVWELLPPSPLLRDAFALHFLMRGSEELAHWVYPDTNGLIELTKTINY